MDTDESLCPYTGWQGSPTGNTVEFGDCETQGTKRR